VGRKTAAGRSPDNSEGIGVGALEMALSGMTNGSGIHDGKAIDS
jgi:hypothetical protein